MRRVRRVPHVPAVLAMPFRALATAYDERNIRRLARRLRCSMEEAREIYRLARRDGFGAAHDAVLAARADDRNGGTAASEVTDSHRA